MKKVTEKLSAIKNVKVDPERVRDRLRRGVILFLVAVFLVGGVGVYLFALFNSNDGSNNSTAARQKELEELIKQQQEEAQKNMEIDQSFVVSGPVTELKIEDIQVGNGEEAAPGAKVKVKYKGALASTGQVFDQSQEPIELGLDQVIEGWQQGIPGMKVGGKRKLIIPAAMGYGGQAAGSIPPNSDLVFEVELTEIVK